MPIDRGYLLANQQPGARTRLELIAELFDPGTFRRISALGIAPGWRCWEVGAGAATVPAWLADRVGPTGHVVATDIDPSWLGGREAGFEVRRHDVAADPPPAGPFDLVHARLVLVHVPDRARALHNMVGSLRPGGRLLVEDADPALQPNAVLDASTDAERLANRLRDAFRTLMDQRGADLRFGRQLPRLLRAAGLVDVRAEASFPIAAPAVTALELATVAQVRDRLLADGAVTEDEIERHLANLRAGGLDLVLGPMIAAWGRKPSGR
jgi:SAM-dependent methyltransferase